MLISLLAEAAVDFPGWTRHLPAGVGAFVGLCFLFQKPIGEWITSWSKRRRGEPAPADHGPVLRTIMARLDDHSVALRDMRADHAEHKHDAEKHREAENAAHQRIEVELARRSRD